MSKVNTVEDIYWECPECQTENKCSASCAQHSVTCCSNCDVECVVEIDIEVTSVQTYTSYLKNSKGKED